MREQYTFTRDAGPDDWSALPRKFAKSETVTRFVGHTYGVDFDDLVFGGVETVPCLADGNEAFFTVPVNMLAHEDGGEVRCDYYRFRNAVKPLGAADETPAKS